MPLVDAWATQCVASTKPNLGKSALVRERVEDETAGQYRAQAQSNQACHPTWCASACTLADRSSPLDTAFHSPAAMADLSIRPRSQVNAPGLYLRCDFKILRSARSIPRSRPRPAFCRLSRCVHRTTPVAKFDLETPCLFPDLRSPSGSLDPYGS